MPRDIPSNIVGVGTLHIDDLALSRSTIKVDFAERKITIMPSDESKRKNNLHQKNWPNEPTKFSCLLHESISTESYAPQWSAPTTIHLHNPKKSRPFGFNTYTYDFTSALIAYNTASIPTEFQSVSISFTYDNLLIGYPPELISPVEFITPTPKRNHPPDERQITLNLTQAQTTHVAWNDKQLDTEFTINMSKYAAFTDMKRDEPRITFGPSISAQIKSSRAISVKDFQDKAIEPLLSLASLLLRKNIEPTEITFIIETSQNGPIPATFISPAMAKPIEYDRSSPPHSNKNGILFDALQHSSAYLQKYPEIKMPLDYVRTCFIQTNFTYGSTLLLATAATESLVKRISRAEKREINTLRKCITLAIQTITEEDIDSKTAEFIKQVNKNRGAFAHADPSQRKWPSLEIEYFAGQRILNAAMQYVLKTRGIPVEIIKRSYTSDFPTSGLYFDIK